MHDFPNRQDKPVSAHRQDERPGFLKRFLSGLFLLAGMGLFCWGLLTWWHQRNVTHTVSSFLDAVIAGDLRTANQYLETPSASLDSITPSATEQIPLPDVRFRISNVSHQNDTATVKVRLICLGRTSHPVFQLRQQEAGWKIVSVTNFPHLSTEKTVVEESENAETDAALERAQLEELFSDLPGVTISTRKIHD